MNISNTARVRLVISDLCRHAPNAKRYLAHNIIAKHSPLDLQLPWFSYAAIDFLEGYLRDTMDVFEWGTGGSTLFFTRRCRSVVSVEDDPQWLQLVKQQIQSQQLPNSTIHFRPYDFETPIDFADSDYVKAIEGGDYDVIVIDGQDITLGERPVCFRVAEAHVRPGGIIVVDDSWRYTSLRTHNRADRCQVFQSTGPARYGVTSTDIYFY
jgi:predicted O-methyltransferase YrrM